MDIASNDPELQEKYPSYCRWFGLKQKVQPLRVHEKINLPLRCTARLVVSLFLNTAGPTFGPEKPFPNWKARSKSVAASLCA